MNENMIQYHYFQKYHYYISCIDEIYFSEQRCYHEYFIKFKSWCDDDYYLLRNPNNEAKYLAELNYTGHRHYDSKKHHSKEFFYSLLDFCFKNTNTICFEYKNKYNDIF